MENPVKVHFRCSSDWCLGLTLECPICGTEQSLPPQTVHTGEEFVCDCGEDIHLSAAALQPVLRELEEVRHLIQKTVTLPV